MAPFCNLFMERPSYNVDFHTEKSNHDHHEFSEYEAPS